MFVRELDLNKPLQLEDGRPVRLICTDRVSSYGYPNIGLVKDHVGDEGAFVFNNIGYGTATCSVINTPTKVARFGLVRGGDIITYPLFEDRESAERFANALGKPDCVVAEVSWME